MGDDSHVLDAIKYAMSTGSWYKDLSKDWEKLMAAINYTPISFDNVMVPASGTEWFYSNGIKWTEVEDTEIKLHKMRKCECGMEKHGFANHSDWCDMWKDNT